MSRKITKQYNEPESNTIFYSKIIAVRQYLDEGTDHNHFDNTSKSYIDYKELFNIDENDEYEDVDVFINEYNLNQNELNSLLEETLDLYEYAKINNNNDLTPSENLREKSVLTYISSDPDNKNNFIYKTLSLEENDLSDLVIYERRHYLYQIEDNGDWALPVRIIQVPSNKTPEAFFDELKDNQVKIHLFRDVSYESRIISNHSSEYYFIDKNYSDITDNTQYPTYYSFYYTDNINKMINSNDDTEDYNYFYKDDLRWGDIIDFSIKISDFSDKKPYLILYKEINLKTSEEDIIYPLIVPSNKIYIKNGFFSWSIANFADNLGHELINNAKTGKLCGLKIFDENENDTFIEDAIVTYTLLTFDD